MREFLITKLVCSKCGNNLTMTNERPQTTRCATGEPTGADMVELAVMVEPCSVCMEPLTRMKRAVAVLLESNTAGQRPAQ